MVAARTCAICGKPLDAVAVAFNKSYHDACRAVAEAPVAPVPAQGPGGTAPAPSFPREEVAQRVATSTASPEPVAADAGGPGQPLHEVTDALAAPWRLKDIGLGILLSFVAFVVISVAFVLPVSGWDQNSPTVLVVLDISTIVWQGAIVAIAYRLARSRGGTWRHLGVTAPRDWKRLVFVFPWWVWVVFGAWLSAEVSVGVYSMIASSTGIDALQPDQQLPEAIFSNTTAIVITGIAVVLTAPLAEEILFRGFIFSGLRALYGFWPAAIASGLIFAVVHAQSGLIIPFAAVGVILAATYYRTGSIFASTAVHFLFNLLSFSALVFLPDMRN